jgi:hypothetical protein
MEKMPVPIILGCEFLNQHIRSIHSKYQTVELLSGQVLPLYNIPRKQGPRHIYVAQGVSLPPYSETSVLAQSEQYGSLFIQNGNVSRNTKTLPYSMARAYPTSERTSRS